MIFVCVLLRISAKTQNKNININKYEVYGLLYLFLHRLLCYFYAALRSMRFAGLDVFSFALSVAHSLSTILSFHHLFAFQFHFICSFFQPSWRCSAKRVRAKGKKVKKEKWRNSKKKKESKMKILHTNSPNKIMFSFLIINIFFVNSGRRREKSPFSCSWKTLALMPLLFTRADEWRENANFKGKKRAQENVKEKEEVEKRTRNSLVPSRQRHIHI